MAYTGYLIIQYIDTNPESSGYGQTWTERVLDTDTCPNDGGEWVLVSTECEMDTSGYTGNRIRTYYNDTLNKYSSTTEADASCSASTEEEEWVASGDVYCEMDENGLYTGWGIQLEVQTNSNLPNYGETRETRVADETCSGLTEPDWEDISVNCHIVVDELTCYLRFDGTADILQIDANPSSPTFNQTRTITGESEDCICGQVEYRWVESGTTCIGYDKWNQAIRQVSYDSGETWTNVVPEQYSATTLIEQNSPDCGYIPPTPTPQYRWYPSGTTCIGYDKWSQSIRQVSYDSGETWINVSPAEYSATTLIEQNSPDCGYVPPTPTPEYRTITTGYTCIEYDKYQLVEYQVSYDSGSTWQTISSTTGSLLESDSPDCGYEPPTPEERWVYGYMCDDCMTYGLMNITSAGTAINSECTTATTITTSMITSRDSLSSSTIGNCYTSIGDGAYSGCTCLTYVRIPDSITSIGDRAFEACQLLLDASIPDSVTSIGSYAFSGCTQLTYVNLPNRLTSLGEYAFRDCLNFTTINIPKSLTSIPTGCFYNADGLSDIILPSTITSIGDSAFQECSGLYNLQINATTPPVLGTNALTNTNADLTIYVPSESVDIYKAASGWSNYANKIQAI